MDAEDYNNHSNSHLRCPKHSFLYNNSDESGSNEASETHGNDEYVLGGDKSLDHSDSEDFHQDRNVDFNCSRNGQSHQGHHSLRDSPGTEYTRKMAIEWMIVHPVNHEPFFNSIRAIYSMLLLLDERFRQCSILLGIAKEECLSRIPFCQNHLFCGKPVVTRRYSWWKLPPKFRALFKAKCQRVS